MRVDGVNAHGDERDRKDRGKSCRVRGDFPEKSARDRVGEHRRESAEDRGVRDLQKKMRAKRLYEECLDQELPGRQHKREVRVRNISRSDSCRRVQHIGDVHEHADLGVPPKDESRARGEKQKRHQRGDARA